jgi:hypothetical protein
MLKIITPMPHRAVGAGLFGEEPWSLVMIKEIPLTTIRLKLDFFGFSYGTNSQKDSADFLQATTGG